MDFPGGPMRTPTEEWTNPFDDPRPAMAQRQHRSSDSSVPPSNGEASLPGDRPKNKKKVGFTGNPEIDALAQRVSIVEPPADGTSSPQERWSPKNGSPDASPALTPAHSRQDSGDAFLSQTPITSKSHLPQLSVQTTEQLRGAISRSLDVPRPRPAIRRGAGPARAASEDEIGPLEGDGPRARSAREAFERGKRLEMDELIHSAPGSRRSSPTRKQSRLTSTEIPLQDLLQEKLEMIADDEAMKMSSTIPERKASHLEAFNLVKRHTAAQDVFHSGGQPIETAASDAGLDPLALVEEELYSEDYQPHPEQYRQGILGAIMKLYGEQQTAAYRATPSLPRGAHLRPQSGDFSIVSSPSVSPPDSGAATPTRHHWFSHKSKNYSGSSLATLVGSSSTFGSPVVSGLGEQVSERLKEQADMAKRPGLGKRTWSGTGLDAAVKKRFQNKRVEIQNKIINHIEGTIERQNYLLKLCKALMQYGAPTHRLEEYMIMSARVLEIDAQFLYIPGAMIVSFEDKTTHTSEVKLVKVAQGLDLGKLRDVHEIYKEVIHDKVSAKEGLEELREVTEKKPKHSRLLRLPVYGLAAVCVGPFAFGARLIDLPISFFLGCILGVLQLYVAPASDLYANVFEISAAVITSFLARAFGSINGGNLFCFAALAQSSIALILPGYTVLCASLELQSRSLVAGSVRMVYAIIYSLFLGYGITIGTAIYGLLDKNATSQTTCTSQISEYWFFFFVPGFAMCLIIINQAKWKQAPVMMIIAFAGYVVNYFSSRRFQGNTQVSNTLGALAIGVLANLYSRVGGRLENHCWDLWEDRLRPRWKALRRGIFKLQSRSQSAKALEEGTAAGTASPTPSIYKPAARRVGYGLAAAAMLPAIFVQVPSGLSVNGSLVSGIASADQITGNATNGTQVVNTTTLTSPTYEGLNSIAFTVGYSVIQVAIGITVGLFLSAIVVYPFGKRRSGLFSF